jgi:hypothetical protein
MVQIFTDVDLAFEEAEALAVVTDVKHAVIGWPDLNGEVKEYLVMEADRAVATAAAIVDSIIATVNDPKRGMH